MRMMSLEDVENGIATLSAGDLAKLRAWLDDFRWPRTRQGPPQPKVVTVVSSDLYRD
jgi:hypothetical protein